MLDVLQYMNCNELPSPALFTLNFFAEFVFTNNFPLLSFCIKDKKPRFSGFLKNSFYCIRQIQCSYAQS